MATPSSIPAWRIPWTEEPGGLQSTQLQGAEHDGIHTQRWECEPSSFGHQSPFVEILKLAW